MEAKKPDKEEDKEEDNDYKEKNKRKTFIPPTMEEIQNYVIEKKLNVDIITFYNYFTEGNWKDAKGNKVKNWKQKLITWSGREKANQSSQWQASNKLPSEKFIEVDTSELTPEEYDKLVKHEITIEELIEKGKIHV